MPSPSSRLRHRCGLWSRLWGSRAGAEPPPSRGRSRSLGRSGRPPALVADRVEDAERWEEIGALAIGESRVAAGLALAGRESRGRLGAVIRELVDRWESEAQ